MNDAGASYEGVQIHVTRWGGVSQDPDGKWVTRWSILLVSDPALHEGPTEVLTDAEQGFWSGVLPEEGAAVTLVVRTSDHAMSGHHYPLTFTSFRLLDERFGPIESIQGLPRNYYAPFRRGSDTSTR